jgi:sortase (surface protein transpeptidase)
MTETVVYQACFDDYTKYNPPYEALPKRTGSGLFKLAKILAGIGIGLLLFSYLPSVWYWAASGLETSISAFKLSSKEVRSLSNVDSVSKSKYEPRYDPTLPLESRVTIKKIGVDSALQEATYDNYQEALENGIWRVSDFGTPTNDDRPIILAAHRFGYLAWSNMFRRKNSFFNLPKLNVGDTVEITWRQRKYTYEIYSKGEGEEITDYSADLILYTCESLNGPTRIFRYARLLEV